MKTKFGSIIVAGSGKIGGHVATKNRSGSALRTKVTPGNPQSNSQSAVRQKFTSVTQSWRSLTAAQRNAWNSAVNDFKGTNVFGDSVTPSGFNLFVSLNSQLLNIGSPVITAPPLPTGVKGISTFSVTVSGTASTMTIIFSPGIDADSKIIVLATPAMSAGRSFAKSQFRQIAVLDSSDTSPYNAKAAYEAKFGAIPQTGTRVFIQLVAVNSTNGIRGGSGQESSISL